MINVNEILKKYMIILWKAYASKADVSGTKKVKNPLNCSNHEIFNGTQSQICKIIVNDQGTTDPNKMQNEMNFLGIAF